MRLTNDCHITIVSVTAPLIPDTISIDNTTGWTIALVTATNAFHSAGGEISQITLPEADIGDVIEIYRNPTSVGEGGFGPTSIAFLPPAGETFFTNGPQLDPGSHGIFFRRIAADKWAWTKSS